METYSKTDKFSSTVGVIKDITRGELYDKGFDRVLSLDDAAFQAFLDMTEHYLQSQHCWTNETLNKEVQQNDGHNIKPFRVMMYIEMEELLATTFNPKYQSPCSDIISVPSALHLRSQGVH